MSALKVALILVGVGVGAAPQPQASLWRGKNTTQSLTVTLSPLQRTHAIRDSYTDSATQSTTPPTALPG